MKKLDKLIIISFVGPFLLAFAVVVFVLLNQHMLRYFDDILGKDVGMMVLATLFFHFSIFMIPMAMPIAVLLSSLITFGSLSERFEMEAIKSIGIPLPRIILPIFFIVLMLTGLAFYVNDNLVPKAALEAYSLLHDIKRKKPALDLKEGIFFPAIPDVNIKVEKKFPDGRSLKDIIIYDSRPKKNKEIIVADSGRMYTTPDGRYLKMELIRGYSYSENPEESIVLNANSKTKKQGMSKIKFDKIINTFDLSSFRLDRTDKKWFSRHRIMRNMNELSFDLDSIHHQITTLRFNSFYEMEQLFPSHLDEVQIPRPAIFSNYVASLDSVQKEAAAAREKQRLMKYENMDTVLYVDSSYVRSIFDIQYTKKELAAALSQAQQVQRSIKKYALPIENHMREYKIYQVQWHKILANSFSCLVMFLIGASLGIIIRKGGLGVPVIISIVFFVFFYVLTIAGEKWEKQGLTTAGTGVWIANAVFLVLGLLFLWMAKTDSRLFESDYYRIIWSNVRKKYYRK